MESRQRKELTIKLKDKIWREWEVLTIWKLLLIVAEEWIKN